MRADQFTVVLTRQQPETAKMALSYQAGAHGRPEDPAEADQIIDLALNLRSSSVLRMNPFQARHLRDALIGFSEQLDDQPGTVKDAVALAREISAALIKHNERNHA